MVCVTCMPLQSVNKAAHSGFEIQRKRHQKSKTGIFHTVAFLNEIMSMCNCRTGVDSYFT